MPMYSPGSTKADLNLDLLRFVALLALLGGVGQELGLDERHDTTLGDDDVAEELVQPERTTR
jgi:hypothetical protein